MSRVGSAREISCSRREQPRLFETDASAPAFSPDGRWIAYASPGVRQLERFVRPASGEGKWQVSPEFGGYPRWSGDGRELFYLGIRQPQRPLMAVSVEGGAASAGPPAACRRGPEPLHDATAPQLDWDAAPDGRRFVFIETERAKDEGTRIDIALHWARHLAAARPGGPVPAR